LFRISQAAMANAVLHSQGSDIRLELVYEVEAFRVRIADNGCGMDFEVIEHGRPGHFGLRGMQERAERIGAKLSIHSQPGSGTLIEVIVPNHSVGWATNLVSRIRSAFQRPPSNSVGKQARAPRSGE
jgi:signal transduction histidine kinase